jgi:hypothetical protein
MSGCILLSMSLSMPKARGGPTLFGESGDYYYAVFVAVVVVAMVIGAVLLYRHSSRYFDQPPPGDDGQEGPRSD